MEPKNLLSLCTTPLKLKILKALEKPMKISQIANELGVSRETVKPHVRGFVESKLVERKEGKYVLTPVGKVVVKKAFEIESLLKMCDELKEFFTSHDLSSIPEELLEDIHMLADGFVVKSCDPFEISSEWVEILEESSWIKGVSPVYHPDFPSLFTKLSEERDVVLILTREVFEKCLRRDGDLLKRFLKRGKMFTCEEAGLALIVAEKGLAMGLYANESYDATSIYVSRSEEAVEWGLKVFEHLFRKAKEVTLNDL